jgi:hypothetical protein
MIVKAQVSPGLRSKTRPQVEQRSRWDHPENSLPSPQCGHRLRKPRPRVVAINRRVAGRIDAMLFVPFPESAAATNG